MLASGVGAFVSLGRSEPSAAAHAAFAGVHAYLPLAVSADDVASIASSSCRQNPRGGKEPDLTCAEQGCNEESPQAPQSFG